MRPLEIHASGNRSVTAADGLGGVRPSSGAEVLKKDERVMKSRASACAVLAAPEDGRTPLTAPPPSLTHYAWGTSFIEPDSASVHINPRFVLVKRPRFGNTVVRLLLSTPNQVARVAKY